MKQVVLGVTIFWRETKRKKLYLKIVRRFDDLGIGQTAAALAFERFEHDGVETVAALSGKKIGKKCLKIDFLKFLY